MTARDVIEFVAGALVTLVTLHMAERASRRTRTRRPHRLQLTDPERRSTIVGYPEQTCRACGLAIILAVNETGQPLALDVAPAQRGGTFELIVRSDAGSRPLARRAVRGPASTARLYRPHSATCAGSAPGRWGQARQLGWQGRGERPAGGVR